MSENINLADKSQLALWQSYCDKKMECESLAEENQRLTAMATKHATRADELYEALEMCIEALERSYDATEWPADGSSQQEVTAVQCREVLERTKNDDASNSNDD